MKSKVQCVGLTQFIVDSKEYYSVLFKVLECEINVVGQTISMNMSDKCLSLYGIGKEYELVLS